MDTIPFLNVSRPGCWAYPDMLQTMGAFQPNSCPEEDMSLEATKAEFAAWCTVSSPLTLSFDMSNTTLYNALFPIITHPKALAINQDWAGSAGFLAKQSTDIWTGDVYHGSACEVSSARTLPTWTVWAKPLSDKTVAAVAINTLNSTSVDVVVLPQDLGFDSSVTSLTATDVWTGEAVAVGSQWTIQGLAPHESQFLILKASLFPSLP
jgi:hypothetical protein